MILILSLIFNIICVFVIIGLVVTIGHEIGECGKDGWQVHTDELIEKHEPRKNK